MERGAFGKKFVLKDNTGNLFFAKEIYEYFKQSYNVPAYTSLFSAFLSCFSHTPYPIGIKIINGKECIIFRYDVAEKESSNNLQTNINNLKKYQPLDCNKLSTLTPSESENFNKLFIHVFFFNLPDRKFENLIFSENGMHHIDIDDNKKFMFDKIVKYQVDYLLQCGKKLAENCSDGTKYQEKAIRKIESIDYGKFIDRFIRNCIVLNVPLKDAFGCLKENLEQMQTSIKNTLELLSQQYIIEQYQNNDWFKALKQGLETTQQAINNNEILQKIMSPYGEQLFNDKFQQKEKELKNQNTTQENKNEEMEGTKKHSVLNISNQDNINTNNMPKSNNLNANNEIHNVSFVNKAKESRNNTDDNRNISDGINNTTSLSTNHFCNDCTNRCLSLCNSCLSLCSGRRKQTTETKSQ